jgi:hypothetical protein
MLFVSTQHVMLKLESAPATYGNVEFRKYDPYPDARELALINERINDALEGEFKEYIRSKDYMCMNLMKSSMHFQNNNKSYYSSYRPEDEHLPLKIMMEFDNMAFVISLHDNTVGWLDIEDTAGYGDLYNTFSDVYPLDDDVKELMDVQGILRHVDLIRDKVEGLWKMYVDKAREVAANMRAYIDPIVCAYPDRDVMFRSDVLSYYTHKNVLLHEMPDGCDLGKHPFATTIALGQQEKLDWAVVMDTRRKYEPGYEMYIHPNLPDADKEPMLGLLWRIAPSKFNQFRVISQETTKWLQAAEEHEEEQDEEGDEGLITDNNFFPPGPMTSSRGRLDKGHKWWEFKDGILTLLRTEPGKKRKAELLSTDNKLIKE